MVNISGEMELSAPAKLAVFYAPPHLRQAFAWLLAFDSRMCGLVERAREPLIAQIRFAWWREMLGKPAAERPTGEPLLAMLADVQQAGVAEAALMLVDAWESQVGDDDPDRSRELRVQAVFRTYAVWAGCSEEERKMAQILGLQWVGVASDSMTSRAYKLRPLSILSLAAQLEQQGGRANGVRLIWHALTGR